MSLLVVGSIAYDTIETPNGRVKDAIGGSAMYFSNASSFFTKTNLVAVIGEDFPESEIDLLKARNIDTSGLKRVKGKTFAWEGKYVGDMNEAQTINTNLNVLQNFDPELPEHYKGSKFVFLANIDPLLQIKVLEQVESPKITAMDTMNFWIDSKKDDLIKAISKIDIVVMNDAEAKLLSNESNIVKAAKMVLNLGPKYVVIKRGEFGVMIFSQDDVFTLPAYPMENVIDPTGAGDSFAGGFMGYLAKNGEICNDSIRRAAAIGTVMASYNIEEFSLKRFKEINQDHIDTRLKHFKKITFLP